MARHGQGGEVNVLEMWYVYVSIHEKYTYYKHALITDNGVWALATCSLKAHSYAKRVRSGLWLPFFTQKKKVVERFALRFYGIYKLPPLYRQFLLLVSAQPFGSLMLLACL